MVIQQSLSPSLYPTKKKSMNNGLKKYTAIERHELLVGAIAAIGAYMLPVSINEASSDARGENPFCLDT